MVAVLGYFLWSCWVVQGVRVCRWVRLYKMAGKYLLKSNFACYLGVVSAFAVGFSKQGGLW